MGFKFVEMRRRLEVVFDPSECEDRRYLGMSEIGKCSRYLYLKMLNGRGETSAKSARLFHEGYLHEHDLVERFAKAGMPLQDRQREIVAPFDGRFKGHIDGALDGSLIEIKSVNDERFDIVLERGAIFEHKDQCQMYMRYGGYRDALIIYKCRSSGELYLIELRRDNEIGDRLERKAMLILAAVDGKVEPPECTCGYCR